MQQFLLPGLSGPDAGPEKFPFGHKAHLVHVEAFAGSMLKVPLQPAGVGVERKRGTREQRLIAGFGASADGLPSTGEYCDSNSRSPATGRRFWSDPETGSGRRRSVSIKFSR